MTSLAGAPTETEGAVLRVGLVGQGIAASLTPALHMREGAEQGFQYRYDLFDLDGTQDSLAACIDRAERAGFAGLNVTHPYKQAVIAHLDALSEDAAPLGAVNTVVFRDGRRIGHNTDWWGFAESFRRFLPRADLGRVVQIGAGGAGAAVGHALVRLGAEDIVLFDAEPGRAPRAADALNAAAGRRVAQAGADLAPAVAAATGLVNATPVGMTKYPGTPLPVPLLRADLWVAEIVYFPLVTELLAAARAAGCRTVDGGGMAVFQAVRAFELFTGRPPDAERMLDHFRRLVGTRER